MRVSSLAFLSLVMWVLVTAVSGKWWIAMVVFALIVTLGCIDFYDQRHAQRQGELTREQWVAARAYAERLSAQAAVSADQPASGKEQANLLREHPEVFWTPKAVTGRAATDDAIRVDGG